MVDAQVKVNEFDTHMHAHAQTQKTSLVNFHKTDLKTQKPCIS